MVGTAIKIIRKKRGISQTDFAEIIGTTQSNLSLLESNKEMPSMARIKLIASELEVNTAILFMMSLDREEVSEDKKQLYDILMPTIKELLLSLT